MCASVVKPLKELAGFQKVALMPGESKRITVELGYRQMRTMGTDFRWRVEPGVFAVMVGDNAANVLLSGEFTISK